MLLEEIFAALANHLTEGFSWPLYLARIGQFWALNVLAFSGFVLGWYWLARRFQYSEREWFYLAGVWGCYAEGLYRGLLLNPLAVALLALPTILTYGVILTPAMLSVRDRGQRHLAAPAKYLLTYGLLWTVSLLPTLALLLLRQRYPDLFPPHSFVP